MNNSVYELLASGRELHAGGLFTKAGDKVSAYVAKATIILPANPVSNPFFDDIHFVSRFDGTPGIEYTMEHTESVSPASWQKVTNITAPITDQGLGVGVFEFRDNTSPSPARFYRAVYPSY